MVGFISVEKSSGQGCPRRRSAQGCVLTRRFGRSGIDDDHTQGLARSGHHPSRRGCWLGAANGRRVNHGSRLWMACQVEVEVERSGKDVPPAAIVLGRVARGGRAPTYNAALHHVSMATSAIRP
jgi:hypothetical protein